MDAALLANRAMDLDPVSKSSKRNQAPDCFWLLCSGCAPGRGCGHHLGLVGNTLRRVGDHRWHRRLNVLNGPITFTSIGYKNDHGDRNANDYGPSNPGDRQISQSSIVLASFFPI